MRKIIILMALLALNLTAGAENRSWNFGVISQADRDAMKADASNWNYDSKNDRYQYLNALNDEPALAGGQPLAAVNGLRFTVTASSSGNLRLGYKSGCCMWLAGTSVITVPDCKKNEVLKVEYTTSKKGEARTFTATNVVGTFPSASSKDTHYTGEVKVADDGNVTLTLSGALYVYTISVTDTTGQGSGSQGGGDDDDEGGSTSPDNPNNPNDQAHSFTYMTGQQALQTPNIGNGPVIWVAPDGNDANDGSESKPLASLQKAVDKATTPGTTIYMKAGTYNYNARVNINERNGTSDNYNSIICPDGRAILDFSSMPYHAHSNNPQQGIRLTSSYWHFYRIDITNASDNGMLIERNKPMGASASAIIDRTQDAHDNIIENCRFYRNGDTGLQIKNLGAFNYILNCDAYENKDEADGDADGFAPKISVGDGNYFYGCRAYNNSDDGYDVFFKKTGGFTDNKTIVFENCLAFENGFLNGAATKGNMNGFKMGSDQGRMNVVLNRCIAANNGSKGFDQNHNSGDIIMNNCTGYATKAFGSKCYSYRIYESIASGSVVELTNCIAINDNLKTDRHPNDPSKHGDGSKKYGRVEVTQGTMTTCDLSVDPSNVKSEDDANTLIAERDENGDLQWDAITWGHPTDNNALLVDKGTPVAANNRYQATGVSVPAIEYAGSAPDLGAFEQGLSRKKVSFGGLATGIGRIAGTQTSSKRVRLVQAFNGMVVLSLEGAKAAEQYTLSAYTADGKLIGKHHFNGTGTAIYLPNVKGMIIMKIEGAGVHEHVKALMR